MKQFSGFFLIQSNIELNILTIVPEKTLQVFEITAWRVCCKKFFNKLIKTWKVYRFYRSEKKLLQSIDSILWYIADDTRWHNSSEDISTRAELKIVLIRHPKNTFFKSISNCKVEFKQFSNLTCIEALSLFWRQPSNILCSVRISWLDDNWSLRSRWNEKCVVWPLILENSDINKFNWFGEKPTGCCTIIRTPSTSFCIDMSRLVLISIRKPLQSP